MKKLSTMLLAFGLVSITLSAFAAGTVNNDAWRTTTSGAPIYAQGGGIYMVGVAEMADAAYISNEDVSNNSAQVWCPVWGRQLVLLERNAEQ